MHYVSADMYLFIFGLYVIIYMYLKSGEQPIGTKGFFSEGTLKIINLSKWCLKLQVFKLANLNAIFLLDDSQMLITYYSN